MALARFGAMGPASRGIEYRALELSAFAAASLSLTERVRTGTSLAEECAWIARWTRVSPVSSGHAQRWIFGRDGSVRAPALNSVESFVNPRGDHVTASALFGPSCGLAGRPLAPLGARSQRGLTCAAAPRIGLPGGWSFAGFVVVWRLQRARARREVSDRRALTRFRLKAPLFTEEA